MRQASPFHRPVCAVLATATFALAATAGCERVDYYSLTGTAEAGSGGAGTTSTTTTASVTTGTTGPSVSRGAVLQATSVCATSLFAGAATAAASLHDAAAAAAKTPDATTKQAVREAWSLAIDRWQQAELVRVGPAGPANLPGGKGLRDLVYSWPLVSPCLIEQTIVAKSYEKPEFLATGLVNTRGLWAAEHLLFNESSGNACSAAASINSAGTWAAMSADELAARKRAYAEIVTADVAAQTKLIADAWSKNGGDFAGQLAAAGQGSALFATEQLAMNAVSDGLFYLDSEVKDLKLGRPIGLIECATATCPEAVESRYAKRSRDHIKNNLLGFRVVFEGCDEGDHLGFDDLLVSLGAGDLAARLKTDLAAAIAAAEALPSSDLAAVLATEPAKLSELHEAIKKLTDAMKTELVTVLDLELPQTIEGDND